MKIQVLDYGYVEFIEAWGTGKVGVTSDEGGEHTTTLEAGIIEAARQSTQGSFRGWETDAKLLKHLWTGKSETEELDHWPDAPKHATPFEFAGMVIEVQAPIFVFREWHRHRTQSYNEMSARYAPLPDLYYLPEILHTMDRATTTTKNKQATGISSKVTLRKIEDWHTTVKAFYARAEQLYQQALQDGIPKEIARITMPVGHYSRMRAGANLRNWLAFLTLRTDEKAQWEIRQYAEAVLTIFREKFPYTTDLWLNERLEKDAIKDT